MFFPISDDDREITTVSYVTYGLLAANVLLFIVQLVDPMFTYGWSVIPKEITSGVDLVEPQPLEIPGQGVVQIPQAPGPPIVWLTLLSSMFMHGGFGHIAGNMLYLWIFGDNVEHRFGHAKFLLFYLSAGLVGSLAQIWMDPDSVIPNLGASGAISGIMGVLSRFISTQSDQRDILVPSRYGAGRGSARHVDFNAIGEWLWFHRCDHRLRGGCCLFGSYRWFCGRGCGRGLLPDADA